MPATGASAPAATIASIAMTKPIAKQVKLIAPRAQKQRSSRANDAPFAARQFEAARSVRR